MPKERTHWWLAAAALQRLPQHLALKKLLETEQQALLIGAVLPDTLLHLIRGPWSATALQLAHDFHEPQEHSYAPLLRFATRFLLAASGSETAQPARHNGIAACLLGIAAHMETDIVFHPYIGALAGDDLCRHYHVETELDLRLLHEGRQLPVRRLRDLLDQQHFEVAAHVLRRVFDSQEKLPPEVARQALQLHSRIQAMYDTPAWQLLASGLALLPIPGLRCRQHLFYPLHNRPSDRPAWPEHWLHPATGQQQHASPDELAEEAITRIADLLCRVDELGLEAAFRQQPGENLVTGVIAAHRHIPTAAGAAARL